MGSILCEHCTAACCRYLALPIEEPESARDYDDLRWYLLHKDVSIFVEEGEWYVQFQTTCKELGADNMCTVYETRPKMCSDYEAGSCDYTGNGYGYDHLFTHAKQVEDFYREQTGKTLVRSRATAPRRRLRKCSSKKSA